MEEAEENRQKGGGVRRGYAEGLRRQRRIDRRVEEADEDILV